MRYRTDVRTPTGRAGMPVRGPKRLMNGALESPICPHRSRTASREEYGEIAASLASPQASDRLQRVAAVTHSESPVAKYHADPVRSAAVRLSRRPPRSGAQTVPAATPAARGFHFQAL